MKVCPFSLTPITVMVRLTLALCTMAFVPYTILISTSISQAAIIGSGDVDPLDPTQWISSTTGYIGKSSIGTITVDGGSGLLSRYGYLGYNSGSTGTATVTGTGSKWTNSSDLYIGYSGSGTLGIEAGGQTSNSLGYLGYNAGSTGTATITGAGSKWMNNSDLYVGRSGSGTLHIEAGGEVSNGTSFLGYNSGSTGMATVTGPDSKWTNLNGLVVGNSGSGTLRIEAGGEVSNAFFGFLGYNAGSTGMATVTGAGSKWTHRGDFYVGRSGSGTLRIEAGGQVSGSDDGTVYLGYLPGSTGMATVTGAGSTWNVSGDFYVGNEGSGSLTVSDGGKVILTGALYASLANLYGNGTISANGGILDADLVFDAGHGLQQAISFGTGGTLNFNANSNNNLGVGYQGMGTLRIADGTTVTSYEGYIGYRSGSTGMATVSGAGSKWTNSGGLRVGYNGNATLRIEAGGQVSDYSGYIGDTGSTSTVTVTGAGSKWTNTSELYVGEYGNGTLKIEAGGQVSNSYNGELGYNSGSSGTATVTGAGSKWTSYSLHVGWAGSGTLRIEAGGQVSSGGSSLGYLNGSSGTVTVTGAGSTWTNNNNLRVADGGDGSLTVSDGGRVINNGTLYASLANLYGDGTISVNGAVLDADLVFDAAHGLQPTIAFGTGGTLSLSQKANNDLGVGFKGNGTLRIADGMTATSYYGYLGYRAGSSGTATVTGAGSKWTSSYELDIGFGGNGTLNIEAGGQVSSGTSYLGYGSSSSSSGTATVTGLGSMWTVSGTLNVGVTRSGTLNIGNGIGSGGLVVANTLRLAYNGGPANVNLQGGNLRVVFVSGGSGSQNFNWLDGTVQNYNTATGLSFAVNAKLSASGTHAFNIDSGRTGTVSGVLSDATSGGTLTKLGNGLLILTAQNTYTGSTTVAAGTLALSSTGSLASSLVDVQSGATFDVSAKSGGLALGAGKTLQGAGTIVGDLAISGIHAPGSLVAGGLTGIETVKGNYSLLGELRVDLGGTTAGTGYDEVLLPENGTVKYNTTLGGLLTLDWTGMSGSTDSSQLWILKNDTAGTLSGMFSNYVNGAALGNHDGRDWFLWYGVDAATGSLTGGNDVVIAAVPEPSVLVLLSIGAIGLFARAWRRSRKVS